MCIVHLLKVGGDGSVYLLLAVYDPAADILESHSSPKIRITEIS